MSENICPFSATLTKDSFSCEHAQKIIRRGGEEFACRHDEMHTRCTNIHSKVKKVALKELDLEDNLLTLPHSVLIKIQFGCLLGLQVSTGNDSGDIENIAVLVESIENQATLPFEHIHTAINNYKSQKRRRK